MAPPGAARACALLALAIALTVGCGSDTPDAASTTPTTAASSAGSSAPTSAADTTTADALRTIDLVFANGQVTGGVRTETVRVGDKVRLRVTSDVAEEVHLHTYDVMKDVAAGQTVDLELTATIPGRHEVELEKKGKQLMTLEVR